MSVSLVERVTARNSATLSVAATIAATPVAGDVLVVRYTSVRTAGARTLTALSGMGATWTRVYDGTRAEFWIGTGANAAGTITGTINLTESNGNSELDVFLVRGLTSTTNAASETTGTGTALTGAAQTATNGQLVITTGTTQATSGATFPSATAPASGWTSSTVGVGLNGSHGGSYRIPTASDTHRTDVASSTSVALTTAILVIGDVAAPAVNADATGSGSTAVAATPVGISTAAAAGTGSTAVATRPVGVTTAPASGAGSGDVSAYAVGGPIPVDVDASGSGTTTVSTVGVGVVVAPATGSGSTVVTVIPVGVVSTAASGSGTTTVVAESADAIPVTGTARTREGGRSRDGVAVATWAPPVVAPPGIMMSGEHRRIRAAAFGTVTMTGTRPAYTVSAATTQRLRTRILVGGKDISFFRGVPTPEPDYQLAEPLLWGPCTIELPQVAAAFETAGEGALSWCAKGKPVVLQRVDSSGVIEAVDYRGVIIGHDTSGKVLRLEIGGHGSGRAQLRHKPMPIFRDTLDLGRLAWAAIRDLGLRFAPRIGPTTGIKQALWGGMDHLAYISELCAKAFDADGQWSLMPDDSALYTFARKDTETVHWTLFNDDARVVADLRSDAAEEPNRIFASGVTPKGQRVRFGVYPNLKPGEAPPYPFDDDSTFGLGTTDDETDTGDGVTVMLRRMWTAGYLSLEDMDGTYDQDVTRALMSLQSGAGLSTTGNMNPATWDALFDVGVTGYTLRGSRIEPAAQDYRVRRYNRSSSGQVIGKNPNFDAHRLIVDRDIDFGSGFTRHQMRDWARGEVARGEDNWIGTITIAEGAILRGDIAPGTTITEADLADVREIRPGQNVTLPHFAGGILLHISGVEITRSEGGRPIARLTVDTQARDAMPVWEMIRRNRETRRDAARRWTGNRASSQVKDSVTEWDEIGGVLYGDVNLRPGWNVVPVVAGQEGSVSRLRLLVQDVAADEDDVVIHGREFACAVFGRAVTPKRLRTLIGNPLAASPDSNDDPDPAEVDPPDTDPELDAADPAGVISTPAGPWWERKAVVGPLRDLDLLYSAGTREEPCGYSPGKKSNGGTRTGLHRTDAGFTYRTRREPVLYLAVWVWGERTLQGGRVMWNQLEAGA